jgi:hypothetical protein
MNTISIRSPYFITVNESGQIGSKVELFIWNQGTTEPTVPTYTFSKRIAQRNDYNISNFVKEYIDNSIAYVSAPTPNNVKNWCYVKVKRYKETSVGVYSLLNTVNYLAVNGYTSFTDGFNNDTEDLLLQNPNIITYYDRSNTNYPYVEVLRDATLGDSIIARYIKGATIVNVTVLAITDPSGQYNFKIPLTTNNSAFDNGNDLQIRYDISIFTTFKCEPISETKYKPVVCQFINRFGGAQFLTFFKAKTDSIDVKGSTYKFLSPTVDYDTSKGQSRVFNVNGTQTVKLNTGWVDENYSDLITDLFLSETILLDGKPALVKTQSSVLKTYLKDKNINYEIEFQYNFNLINDVV